jgi:hypothetical protein
MGRKKKNNVVLYMRVPQDRLDELKEMIKKALSIQK